PGARLSPDEKRGVRSLIRKLADDGPESDATLFGGGFAPLPNHMAAAGLFAGVRDTKPSEALRRLVGKGPDVLPFSLEALEDTTKTKSKMFRSLGFNSISPDRLYTNPINRIERKAALLESNDDQEDFLINNTLRIGDLSFVAIGQIVGRHYQVYTN